MPQANCMLLFQKTRWWLLDRDLQILLLKKSVIIQKNAPLNVTKWKYIPDSEKESIVTKVMDSFHIDATQHNKDVILETVKRHDRSHRKRLHDYVKKSETNEEALEHEPEDVSEEDWEFLVNYFSSLAYKLISKRNKGNWAKQVINHICGRKTFGAVSCDVRDLETGKELNFQNLWKMTHMRNNGSWVDDAFEDVHKTVQEVSTGILQDVGEDTDKDPIINAAFKYVVGE